MTKLIEGNIIRTKTIVSVEITIKASNLGKDVNEAIDLFLFYGSLLI